ncbi:MAG: pyrroline-5-carboxylate reductase [Ruminococcaceae bacterium]|nr:pyrroline-5-carboxylate reductase [Oscillospiraceae bacterium]
MKIGFIGCGNMAKAIMRGIITANLFQKTDIYASDAQPEILNSFCEQQGIQVSKNAEIATKCDIILLAVKPQVFPAVLPEIAPVLNEDSLVISIAAGKTIEFIGSYIGAHKIIRIMPNLNATIGKSVSALCTNSLCNESDRQTAKRIFESIGSVFILEEKDFSAFSAVACCSPAFSFLYIDSLAKAGIACGLDKSVAYDAAIASVIGSAEMLKASEESPQVLIERVCSPGGTTIEGVHALQDEGFPGTIKKAVEASFLKDKKL